MKRRRMYRYAQAAASYNPPRAVPQGQLPSQGQVVPLHQAPSPEQVFFERGVAHGMRLAQQQQHGLIADIQRRALQDAHSQPFLVLARQRGYDEGYAAALRSHGQQPGRSQGEGGFSYADLEHARQRGFEEGRRAAGGIPNVGDADVRKKAIDDVMAQVRVISESNPNMTSGPFLNALKHRLKKLK